MPEPLGWFHKKKDLLDKSYLSPLCISTIWELILGIWLGGNKREYFLPTLHIIARNDSKI